MCRPRAAYSRPRLRQVVLTGSGLASAPRAFMGLKCPSMRSSSQGFTDRYHRMAETFHIFRLQLGSGTVRCAFQSRVEEGGSEGSKRTLKTIPCPDHVLRSQYLRKVLRLAAGLHGYRGNFLNQTFSTGIPKGGHGKLKARHIPLETVDYSVSIMAPRTRATPRRGRNSGQRGGTGGRGHSSPRRISPLAYASPPSFESEDSGFDLSNSVQTANLHYRRRMNKPIVKALITVIFSEEDDEEGSWKAETEEKTPPSSDNSTKIKDLADSSYSPESQSRLEEESTLGYSTEQAEALREIGSLKGKEPMEISQNPTDVQPEVHGSKPSSPQSKARDKEPDDSFANILYLKLSPGIERIEDIPDGMEVTWERDPEREAEDRKKRDMEREAEDQKKQHK